MTMRFGVGAPTSRSHPASTQSGKTDARALKVAAWKRQYRRQSWPVEKAATFPAMASRVTAINDGAVSLREISSLGRTSDDFMADLLGANFIPR